MKVGRIIDGKAFAARLREQVAVGVESFAAQAGRKPGLAVVLVGEDPASSVYVRNKGKATLGWVEQTADGCCVKVWDEIPPREVRERDEQRREFVDLVRKAEKLESR